MSVDISIEPFTTKSLEMHRFKNARKTSKQNNYCRQQINTTMGSLQLDPNKSDRVQCYLHLMSGIFSQT